MPHENMQYLPKKNLMTYEEIERLLRILASMGITKVRFTGGEPFVRNDLMKLIRKTTEIEGIKDIHLTTNGILTAPHIPELKNLGIASVNLSLDTLDKQRFFQITQRDEYDRTLESLDSLLTHEIPVKINTVVMAGKNTEDLIPLAELTRSNNLEVRFIEEMPFNGQAHEKVSLEWHYRKILSHLEGHFGPLEKLLDGPNSTSYTYKISGFLGRIGIIAAYSRTFCGTCNRIRITPQGMLKTCLYASSSLNLRDLMREGYDNEALKTKLLSAFRNRAKDGFEAEQIRANNLFESMSTIGG